MSDAKQCPTCEQWRLKDNACNFVTCNNNYQKLNCKCSTPWCFMCGKVKGKSAEQCHDKTHNSH